MTVVWWTAVAERMCILVLDWSRKPFTVLDIEWNYFPFLGFSPRWTLHSEMAKKICSSLPDPTSVRGWPLGTSKTFFLLSLHANAFPSYVCACWHWHDSWLRRKALPSLPVSGQGLLAHVSGTSPGNTPVKWRSRVLALMSEGDL